MKKLLFKRIILMFCLIASSLAIYAIDPLGSRVDFDDDYNNSYASEGLMVILTIAMIGIAIYVLYSNIKERLANRPQKESIEMYSHEWFKLEEQRREKKKKDERDAGIGCIFGMVLFGGMVIWGIFQDAASWLEAIGDIFSMLVGLAILGGIFWLISRIMDR